MEQHVIPNLTHDCEPIVALSTPRGSGAIAIIRISGTGSIEVTDKITRLSSNKKLYTCDSHTVHHGFVVDAMNVVVDECLVVLMRAPKTFTGQDTVEINCHNNAFIIDKIINLLIAAGARHAKAGEFTMRAFLNGKIDLLQAEAINDLLHATSEKSLQYAMAQVQGSLSEHFIKLEEDLVNILTLCEASFEFLEEEQRDFDIDALIKNRVIAVQTEIGKLKTSFNTQKHLKDGVRIALIGTVNAGKSSLFNALIGKERAIVADVEGTTRDSIEYSLYKQGYFWLLIDTAGIRKTGDIIEQQGIIRSFNEAAQADVVLLVIDGSKPISSEEEAIYKDLYQDHKDKTLVIINKGDISPSSINLSFIEDEKQCLLLSATQKTGLLALEEAIEKKIQVIFSAHQSPFILNERQAYLLEEIDKGLTIIINNLQAAPAYELIAYHLNGLLTKTSEMTGKTISEGILDTVFNKFCIGK